MMKQLIKLTLVLFLITGVSACSDYLDPSTPQNKPPDSIDGIQDLEALINGTHNQLAAVGMYGRNFIINAAVRTDNAFSTGSSNRFLEDTLFEVLDTQSNAMWSVGYQVIANCNLIINSDIESSPQVDHIKGQAYALRALAHMNILLAYGQQYVADSDLGIPHITTFGEEDNYFPSRPAVQETWDRIGADFQQAIVLMNPDLGGSGSIMSYYAALGLQARYYLYTGQYAEAAVAAKEVIDSGNYALVSANNYLKAWGTDGQPSFLFSIAMTETDNRGINGISYIVLEGTGYGDVEVTPKLFNIFETNDVRNGLYTKYIPGDETDIAPSLTHVTYRVTGKYPDRYTNIPVIRYAEVILTYAEAQARLGNTAEALLYLNKIPANRNASTYATASVENILAERRKELAMEGLYFWDLMRTGSDIVRTNLQPELQALEITVPYGDFRLAYPIPRNETDANPNMQQNDGY